MHATAEAAGRYIDRFPAFRDAGFYRTALGLSVSSLGIGTYLGKPDDEADRAYTEALIAAGEAGINHRDQRVPPEMPESVARLLPGLATNAQRAIQFTRSTPGITVALVGMGRPGHVRENLGVALAPPATPSQYARFYT